MKTSSTESEPAPSADAALLPRAYLLRNAPRSGRAIVLGLLLYGLFFSYAYVARGWFFEPIYTLLPLVPALLGTLIWPIRSACSKALDRWERFSRHHRFAAFCLIVTGSAAVLLAVALAQGRTFLPLWHDELSYLVQMQAVRHGRLWMPPHPLGPFFDTFHFVQDPVYASMYPIGTALLYTPLLMLGLPTWVPPLLCVSLSLGLLYLIVAELVDDTGAVLAVLIGLAMQPLRMASLMVLSQPVILLLIVLAIWIYLRWRSSLGVGQSAERPRRIGMTFGWMAALGLVVGFAAVTRPLDALCAAHPLAVAVIVDLVRLSPPSSIRKWSLALATLTLGFVTTLPLPLLQLWTNYQTSGDATLTLYEIYHQQHYPELMPGFHDYEAGPSPSPLLQKQVFHEEFILPYLTVHTPEQVLRDWFDPNEGKRAYLFFHTVLPGELSAALLPAGLLFLRDRRRVAIVSLLLLFLAGYGLYAMFLRHYTVAALPAVALLLVGAVRGLGPVLGRGPAQRERISIFLFLLIAAACICRLPPLYAGESDEGYDPDEMLRLLSAVERVEAETAAAGERGVLLIRYSEQGPSPYVEPVYNTQAPWPDGQRVLRAHDLGARNMELFRYYAEHQPDRVVYHYDRATGQLRRLGPVTQLADRADPPPASTRSADQ